MLNILWIILKIILWLVLIVLGLLLLVVILVLFSPVRYRVSAYYKDKARVKAKVRFLFVSIMIDFSQEDKSLNKCIRIAGIRLKEKDETKKNRKSRKSKKDKSDEDKSDNDKIEEISVISDNAVDTDENAVIEKNSISDEESDILNELDVENGLDLTKDAGIDEPFNQTNDNQTMNEDSESRDNDSKGNKLKDIWDKLTCENILDMLDKKSDEISEKYNRLEKIIKRYRCFWDKEYTIKTRRYIGKYLLSLIRHIGPRKLSGSVCFGSGDPAQTGIITGYLSLCPFMYQKNFTFSPDFYEKRLELDVDMKGRIRLGYILRIVTKPYIWRTIKVFKKLSDMKE